MAVTRPRLRPVDIVVGLDRLGRRMLTLRDGEGVAPRDLTLEADAGPILARMDGTRTSAAIAREVSQRSGGTVDVAVVEELCAELERGFFLDSLAYRARRQDLVRAFTRAPRRPALFAGGAYHGDRDALDRFIHDECLAHDSRAGTEASTKGHAPRPVALCAPHMDLWRCAVAYGHAYGALRRTLSADIDTFVVLGTCHAGMSTPFAVCDKVYETPLGDLEPASDLIDELCQKARFDARADEYMHRGEHSIEFQTVFLRHALGDRPARIVPILCGLGQSQARRSSPRGHAEAESFLAALVELVDRERGRTLVVAGADLAHVGPRFGDSKPLDDGGRQSLAARDEETVGTVLAADAEGFFDHATRDLDTRRICGVGPIYTLLRTLPSGTNGHGRLSPELLRYEQCVDPQEGSVVSHASVGFFTALDKSPREG